MEPETLVKQGLLGGNAKEDKQAHFKILSSQHNLKMDDQRHPYIKFEKRHDSKICGNSYSYVSNMKRHYKKEHESEQFQSTDLNELDDQETKENGADDEPQTQGKHFYCEICKTVFTRIDSLRKHNLRKHGSEPLQPLARFNVEKFEEKDDKNEIEPKLNSCQICRNYFISKDSLKTHIKKCHQSKAYLCKICGVTFTRKFSRGIHMLKKHSLSGANHIKLFSLLLTL